MRGAIIYGAILAGLIVVPGYGQVFDSANFRNMSVGGIGLYGVSAFSGYSTSAYPGGLGQLPIPGVTALGADENYGVTASGGWQHHRERTNISVLYSGTYLGMVHYSGTDAFSQYLTLSVSRRLSSKWTFTLSGTGSDSTMVQFLFQPTAVGLASLSPASFDDLAAAFSVGQFSSSQVAATLTGAPVLDSPARTLLLGERILSYSGQASLNFAYSSRLSFHLASFSAGGQHRSSQQDGVTEPNYVIPRSLGVNGGAGMSYQLSPRTTLGVDAEASRTSNLYQNAYTTTASASFGRKMGMHWFVNLNAGGSMSQITAQAYGTPRTRNIIGGGAIGFRTYRHSLVGSYARSSSDAYGLAIGTTTTLSAGWNWHRPGSQWSVFASFGQQQVRNTGYASLSGWQASGGVAQTLNSHMQMSAQYVYLRNSGDYLGAFTNLAIHSVRVSLSWSPQELGH